MQIVTSVEEPQRSACDLVALGVLADGLKAAPVKPVDAVLKGALAAAAKDQDFSGKPRQQLVLHTLGELPSKRVALLGLGARDEITAELLLRWAATAVRLANSVGAQSLLLVLPELPRSLEVAQLIARGVALGGYRYDEYRSDKGRPATLRKVTWHVNKAAAAAAKSGLAVGSAVAESVALARDLVNMPPLDLYPETFAARASKLAKAAGVKCQVLGPDVLKKKNMNLLLAVGQGSEQKPRLVHLSYTPAKGKAAAPVVLVGKGITFDSGGLSLKPPDAMYGMKMDMGGAAAALATILAAAKLKIGQPVHAILALAENMPSGSAIRPGDVVTSAAGKTIEINNTDAEGRLVLADALHYAGALKPRCIVDLATLTGACMVALGHHTTGLFSNDDKVADALLHAARRQGEDFWRLPLTPVLRDQLKSDIADMRNTGERFGGAITAALFLKEFVGKTPWAHLDIAGPATSHEDAGILTKGGTGVGVAALVEFITSGARA